MGVYFSCFHWGSPDIMLGGTGVAPYQPYYPWILRWNSRLPMLSMPWKISSVRSESESDSERAM